MVQNIINKKNGKIEKGIGSLYGGETSPVKLWEREGERERDFETVKLRGERERERVCKILKSHALRTCFVLYSILRMWTIFFFAP